MFKDNRIVFWTDAEEEYSDKLTELELGEAELVCVDNNEFGLKYRMLIEEPKQKFLVYRNQEPENAENWLLDIELASPKLYIDKYADWLEDLGWSRDLKPMLVDYEKFFSLKGNRKKLTQLGVAITGCNVKLQMLNVAVGIKAETIQEFIFAVFEKLAEEDEWAQDELESEALGAMYQKGLSPILWELLHLEYGYHSDNPSIKDFALSMLQLGVETKLHNAAKNEKLNSSALALLNVWKDSKNAERAFKWFVTQVEDLLEVNEVLENEDFKQLIKLDYLRSVENAVVMGLMNEVQEGTISERELNEIIAERKQKFWYTEYELFYEALKTSAEFLNKLKVSQFECADLESAVDNYCQSWYELDLLYRRYMHAVSKHEQGAEFKPLTQQMNHRYNNQYLLKLGNEFQKVIDKVELWYTSKIQKKFFDLKLYPYVVSKGQKICVIISDAMRYEVGKNLEERINSNNRYQVDLDALVAMLPSYTQLGMAALLPNRELSIQKDGTVQVDGITASGLDGRKKVLENNSYLQGKRICVADAKMVLGWDRKELMDNVKNSDVFYIYHNHIDSVGDKLQSEDRVFDAVEESLAELEKLIKALFAGNVSRLFVTADHGFLYQQVMEESDFSAAQVDAENVAYRNRRFLLAKGAKENAGVKVFTSLQLGLDGELDVVIPNSINRLRLAGSGYKYVHGGASLQEIVVPLLEVSKNRKDDVRAVDVQILRGDYHIISTNEVLVKLYQKEAVTDKLKARELRLGLFTKDGTLISDTHTLKFDSDSENVRDREIVVKLTLSSLADNLSRSEQVYIQLEEQIKNTERFKVIDREERILRRLMKKDFDF